MGFTWITLTARATAELVIDTTCFVTFGTKHKKTAETFHLLVLLFCRWIAAKLDVDTAARHVRCNNYATLATCLCDDFAFTLVVLCVEYFVRHTFTLQVLGKQLVLFNRCGTNEYRLPRSVKLLYLARNCLELAGLGLINEVRTVETPFGPVRVKVVTTPSGRLRSHPEWEDVRALSEKAGLPAAQLLREIASLLP